jgi:hypothetical protein
MLVGVGSGVALLELAAVLLLLLLGVTLLGRKFGRGGLFSPGRAIQLTQHHAVHVIELEGRRLLIGTGPGGAPHLVTELGPIPDPLEPGDG